MSTNSLLYDAIRNPVVDILITILIAIVAQSIGRRTIERLVRRAIRSERFDSKIDEQKREDTVVKIVQRTFVTLVWLVVIIAILTISHVNIAALLTGAGLFGVIIGLGAQNTIKDYLAGIYILTENQYRVGDVVSLSGGTTSVIGASGVVEEISLRITKLRDADGTLSIIRNGEAGIITNRTFKYANVMIDVVVDYNEDIETVETTINAVGMAMLEEARLNKQIIESIHFLRVDGFTEAGVLIKAIGKVQPASQWDIGGEYRRRLVVAFHKAHIQFAVPRRSVTTKAASSRD